LLLGSIVLSETPQGVYNSIVATGAAEGRYDKRHLVPFGEYFPIPDWLRPLLDVLGTPYSDFLFGAAEQPPLPIAGQPVGLFICFEDVFADEFRRSAREATLLVSVTNDAWFGRSIAAEQHLAMARLRSLETGRETIRASNTGRSALIGADGSLLAASGFFTTELLRAQAQPRSGQTPYARWGDTPLWLLVILALLVLALRRRYSA
jgi:apolipoprotein N-acyltransferase